MSCAAQFEHGSTTRAAGDDEEDGEEATINEIWLAVYQGVYP